MERRGLETNLAWALALAAKPYLDAIDRNDVFVAIGAGETLEAICRLLKLVALKQIPVGPDVVWKYIAWLRGYVGHEDEQYLYSYIDDFVRPKAAPIAAMVRVNHLPTTPPPRPLTPWRASARQIRQFAPSGAEAVI